jgi:hypothetical protein
VYITFLPAVEGEMIQPKDSARRRLIMLSELLVCMCVGMPMEAAQPGREKGEGKALIDVQKVWAVDGPAAALTLAELAHETFPKSLEIQFSVAALREIQGESAKALEMFQKIAAEHGQKRYRGPAQTVAQYTVMPRYRLNLQLGRPAKALPLLRKYSAFLLAQEPYSTDKAVARAFAKVLEAEIFVDGLRKYADGAAALIEAEAVLRPGAEEEAAGRDVIVSALRELLYRQCRHELVRLQKLANKAGRPVELPADLPPVPPMKDYTIPSAKMMLVLLREPTAGGFHLPLAIKLHHQDASHTYYGSVGAQSPSRAIRAICCYEAGIYALESENWPAAVKWFTLSAETDTWFAPVAAAALARVAAAHADRTLSSVAERCKLEAKTLASVRSRLAKEFAKGGVGTSELRD